MQHKKPEPEDYILVKTKRYRITNRISREQGEVSVLSAQEACQKLGWMIGDCFIEELKT